MCHILPIVELKKGPVFSELLNFLVQKPQILVFL